jgi:hypothetical protein
MADLIALIGAAFEVLMRVYDRAPMQFWAIAACWLAGIAITQQLKFLLSPTWSSRRKQLATFAIGFGVGALIPWALWPPSPWRVQLAVAFLGGLGATSSYAITVRALGLFWPSLRARMSVHKGASK